MKNQLKYNLEIRMKRLFKDPESYLLIGLLGLTIAIPSENLYVNVILIPIFFLMQIGGVIFILKKYLREKKGNSYNRVSLFIKEYTVKLKMSSNIISFIVFETIALTSIWDILVSVSIGERLLWLLLYTQFVIELGFVVVNINFVHMIEDYKENNKQLFLFLNGRLLSLYVLVAIALLCFVYSVFVDQTYIIFAVMILLGRFSDKPNILYINNGKLYYSNNRFVKMTQVQDHKIENTLISIALVDGKNIRINIKDENERKEFERAISDLHIKNE